MNANVLAIALVARLKLLIERFFTDRRRDDGRIAFELLEAAGVDTVKELRHRNAENLAAKMAEVNEAKKLTRRVPDADQIQGWLDEAKNTEPTITH